MWSCWWLQAGAGHAAAGTETTPSPLALTRCSRSHPAARNSGGAGCMVWVGKERVGGCWAKNGPVHAGLETIAFPPSRERKGWFQSRALQGHGMGARGCPWPVPCGRHEHGAVAAAAVWGHKSSFPGEASCWLCVRPHRRGAELPAAAAGGGCQIFARQHMFWHSRSFITPEMPSSLLVL